MTTQPSFSIVIPVRNEELFIERCIKSLINLDYPPDKYEIIFIDNGSTDRTVQIIKDYDIKVLILENAKVGAVRNAGANEAKGEILAFTDGDCIIPSNWLTTASSYLQNTPNIGAVGGACLAPEDGTWLEKAWVTEQQNQEETVKYLPGSDFIIPKNLFESLGAFNEVIVAGEDDDLSRKIRDKGLQLLSLKDCFVIHLGYPKKFFAVFKRQVWHARNSTEIKEGNFDKMFIATNIFSLNIVLLPFSLATGNIFLMLFSLFIIYLIVALSTIKRAGKHFKVFAGSTKKYFQLNVIFFFFFLGRSLGLLLNYRDIFMRKLTKHLP